MPRDIKPVSIGIDLGGSKILTGLVDSQGKILVSDERATPATKSARAVTRAILDSVHDVLENGAIRISEVAAVGIGAAGISNPDTGVVFASPHLPRWRDVPLRDILQEKLGKQVFLMNDANAAALGEFYFGAARSARDFIYITLSTGIGGGIVIGGRLYTGTIGCAGEVGHMTIDDNGPVCGCGNRGCWEALASGTALAEEAKRRIKEGTATSILRYAGGRMEKVTAEIIHKAAQRGDSLARELIGRTGYYVGVGLANLINIFNPELIVIGGGLSNIGDMLLQPAFKVARQRAYEQAFQAVRFASAELGRNSGMLGAAAYALQETEKHGRA